MYLYHRLVECRACAGVDRRARERTGEEARQELPRRVGRRQGSRRFGTASAVTSKIQILVKIEKTKITFFFARDASRGIPEETKRDEKILAY